jgi:hypothetical protein
MSPDRPATILTRSKEEDADTWQVLTTRKGQSTSADFAAFDIAVVVLAAGSKPDSYLRTACAELRRALEAAQREVKLCVVQLADAAERRPLRGTTPLIAKSR